MAEKPPFFMSLWSEIASDGDEILECFGRSVTFRGTTHTVLLAQNPLEQMMGDGGFIFRAGFNVRMLAKDGSALRLNPPAQGEIFTIFGREYTATSITNRPPSPWIDCLVQSTTQ